MRTQVLRDEAPLLGAQLCPHGLEAPAWLPAPLGLVQSTRGSVTFHPGLSLPMAHAYGGGLQPIL